jgi:hypothetical protein
LIVCEGELVGVGSDVGTGVLVGTVVVLPKLLNSIDISKALTLPEEFRSDAVSAVPNFPRKIDKSKAFTFPEQFISPCFARGQEGVGVGVIVGGI